MSLDEHGAGNVSRRSLLRAAGTASVAWVAGCGGGDDGGGTDDAEGDGTGDAGEFTCTDLGTVDYTAYDAGETPMICDWDAPQPFLEAADISTGVNGMTHQGSMSYTMDGEEHSLEVGVRQLGASASSVKTATRRGRDDLEAFGGEVPGNSERVEETIQFDGQTLDLYEDLSMRDTDTIRGFVTDLPREVDGHRIYITVNFQVGEARQTEASEDCLAAMRDAAIRIAQSVTVNDDTTLGSEIVPTWDGWPWDWL